MKNTHINIMKMNTFGTFEGKGCCAVSENDFNWVKN